MEAAKASCRRHTGMLSVLDSQVLHTTGTKSSKEWELTRVLGVDE